jgi:hypothetical protein
MLTHKIILEKKVYKFLSYDEALRYYQELNNDEKLKIKIFDKNDLSFIQKYKNDVELKPLTNEEKLIENSLLKKDSKNFIYKKIEEREKENKLNSIKIIKNIILSLNKNDFEM